MKKKLVVLLLTSLAAFSMCACGDKSGDDNTQDKATATQENGTSNQVPAKDVVDEIVKNLSDLPEMESVGMSDDDAQDTFEYLCDFDYEGVSDFYITYSTDAENAPAQEVLVVRLKNEDDVNAAVKALEDRVARRKNQFMTYMPTVLPVVNCAKVVSDSNYVALIISEDSAKGEVAFRAVEK